MQDGACAGGDGGIHLLLAILADGEEQARQLGELADDQRSRAEHYRAAARRLQCALGKAVSVAKAIEAASGSSRGTDRSDSPRSADESSGGTAAMEAQERQGVCKRRKGLPRWTSKCRVPDANLDATPDDGFSWRKYGQKDILGAKFPRGYYRCTYRTAQGCPATKQVQRSDSDLCVFDVTYQGQHTCRQRQRHADAGAGAAAVVTAHGGSQSPPAQEHEHQDPSMSMQLLAGFNDVLKVETAEAPAPAAAPLHGHGHDGDAASFSFYSAPFHAAAGVATDSSNDPSPSGGPSYFSVPRCPAGRYGDYDDGAGVFMCGPGSELGEVVSRATAPAPAGFDSSLYHHAELDPHLPFAPFGGPSRGSYQ